MNKAQWRLAYVLPLAMGYSMAFLGCGEKVVGEETKNSGLSAEVLAACPQASSQTESLDWLQCLEGKSVQGHDVENASILCSAKFLSGNRVEFNYNGTTYSNSSPASWSLGSFENHVNNLTSKRQLSGLLISNKAEPNSIQSVLLQYTAGATLNQLQIAIFGSTESNNRMICTVQ